MNFIALAIIAEFDDIFYEGLPKIEFTRLTNKLTIMKTSSSRCRDDERVKIWIPEENFKLENEDNDSDIDNSDDEDELERKPIVRPCNLNEELTPLEETEGFQLINIHINW